MKRILMLLTLALLFCPALAYAQTDPDIPGLDWANLVAAAGVIVFVVNMVKDLFHVTGKAILIISGTISLAWAVAIYQPNVQLVIIAGVLCWAVATGAWAGAKKLFHKAGEVSAKS